MLVPSVHNKALEIEVEVPEFPPNKLIDAATMERYAHGRVFSRMTPDDKCRLVVAHQSVGECVLATGDGFNDGPALASADVGVAMVRRFADCCHVRKYVFYTRSACCFLAYQMQYPLHFLHSNILASINQ